MPRGCAPRRGRAPLSAAFRRSPCATRRRPGRGRRGALPRAERAVRDRRPGALGVSRPPPPTPHPSKIGVFRPSSRSEVRLSQNASCAPTHGWKMEAPLADWHGRVRRAGSRAGSRGSPRRSSATPCPRPSPPRARRAPWWAHPTIRALSHMVLVYANSRQVRPPPRTNQPTNLLSHTHARFYTGSHPVSSLNPPSCVGGRPGGPLPDHLRLAA